MLRPHVATAALFLLVPVARGQNPRVPPASKPPEIFGQGRGLEITLEGALELALANNLILKIEDLSSEAALHAAKGSWGAFDWVIDATGGISDSEFKSESTLFSGSSADTQSFGLGLTRQVTTGGTFRAGFDTANTRTDNTSSPLPTTTSDAVTLSYVQPLLRGAWRQYATAFQTLSDLAWRRQLEREREVRQAKLLEVSNAYWDLVAARADREVAESNLALARTQLDQDSRRLEAGVGTPIDVLAAETQVANREETLLATDVRVRERADALRKLILPGADPAQWETELIPSTPLPPETSASAAPAWSGALETAIRHRPILREQRFQIEEQKVIYEQRLSEKRPLLDLALSATGRGFSGDSGDAFEEAIGFDFPTYQASLNFSFPIGNRFAKGAERSAWANLRAANFAYDETESQVAGEVRAALRQITYSSEAVRAATKSLDLARRQLEVEERRHEEGISNYFQLLEAQQELALSRSTELHARANYAKALAAALAAQGLIGEDIGR